MRGRFMLLLVALSFALLFASTSIEATHQDHSLMMFVVLFAWMAFMMFFKMNFMTEGDTIVYRFFGWKVLQYTLPTHPARLDRVKRRHMTFWTPKLGRTDTYSAHPGEEYVHLDLLLADGRKLHVVLEVFGVQFALDAWKHLRGPDDHLSTRLQKVFQAALEPVAKTLNPAQLVSGDVLSALIKPGIDRIAEDVSAIGGTYQRIGVYSADLKLVAAQK